MTSDWVAYGALAGFAVAAVVAYLLGPRYSIGTVPVLAVLIAVVTFALDQIVPLSEFPIVYLAYAVAPLILFYWVVRGWEGSRWGAFGLRFDRGPWRTVLLLSAGLVGLYLLLTLEPGIVLGFHISSGITVASFALYFLSTPLLILGEEAVFRGFFLTKLSERVPLPTAFLISGAFFAAFLFNPFLLGVISVTTLGELVFTNLLLNLLLGVVSGIFFYKADWNLLGPWTFRTGILWASILVPIAVATGWPTVFTFEVLAFGAVLAVIYAALQEPRYQARHFLREPLNPRRRTLVARVRARKETLRTSALVVTLAVIVLVAGPPLLRSNSAPFRLYAIATGSMVPTFPIGTLVVVEPIPSASDIHTGEIVAYNAPYLSTSGPVVHRVIAIHTVGGALQFTFKGDHNTVPDPKPVQFSQVVGAVVASVPALGYLVLAPTIGLSLVAGIVILAIYWSAPGSASRIARRPILPFSKGRSP